MIRIQKQRGFALILLFLAILLSGTEFFVTSLSIDRSSSKNEMLTTEALAKAKEALLSFAITYNDTTTSAGAARAGMFGFLPCPEDTGSPGEGFSQGSCGAQYESYLGRLPWRSLSVEPLKDSAGSCLWYAVSSDYKNSGPLDRDNLLNSAGLSRSEMLNADSKGSFTLFDTAGNQLAGVAPDNRVVAVIIAPGRPMAGQNRVNTAGTVCGGDFTANNFLESINTSITTSPNFIDDFVTSTLSSNTNINDRIITITQQEIFDAIQRRTDFPDLMRNTTQALAKCVAQFGVNNSSAGGCDVDTCKAQCANDRDNCRDQCDVTRSSCRGQCDIDRAACLAAGNSNSFCNQQRTSCRAVCNTDRESCRTACDTVQTACDANCDATCGGGGGGNAFMLPWPAAMNLAGSDYRDSRAYIEDVPPLGSPGNHLGRFAVDVSDTDGKTSNSGDQYLLENNYCNAVVTDNGPVNLNTDTTNGNSIERRIWQNWKDHFFYAVAGDYDASNTSTPTVGACVNCLQSNGAGEYAAIVFYAGQRLGSLQRYMLPDADTKNVIGNYLEGNNASNFGDITGNGNYQVGTVNDIAYCINEVLDSDTPDPLDTKFEVINCTGP